MAIDDLKTYTVPSMLAYKNQRREPTGFEAHKDPIHSGHFMVSNVHDDNADDDDSDGEKHLAPLTPEPGYNFVKANKETSATYQFGPRSTKTMGLDPTLTKLFQCMTLAYSGTITSPKWKTFRGLSLAVKDKVRLNNIIWREWHMQYVFKRMPVVCQFATPLSDDIHLRPEAVVLEGKYWKRRLDTVTAEYKKWRRYFKNRRVSGNRGDDVTLGELLDRVADTDPVPRRTQQSSTDLLLTGDSELEAMEFNDSLFNLNQPIIFPSPREFSQLGGCSDLIQPNLIPLQPDFMETDFEIFSSRIFASDSDFPSFQAFGPASSLTLPTSMDTSVGVADSVDLLPNNFVSTASITSNTNNNNNAFSLSFQQLLANLEGAGAQGVVLQNPQPALPPQTHLVPSSTPVPMSQTFGCPTTQSPSQKAPNLTSVLIGKPLAQAALPVSKAAPSVPSPLRSTRTRQSQGRATSQFNQTTSAASPPNQGKDGFAVPQGKPLQTPRKPRTIAPAPPATTAAPSPSTANTYLAQLLTKGTYPGAVIDVKKEPTEGACAGNFTPIRPAAPVAIQSSLNQASLPQAAFPAQLPLNSLDFTKMKPDFATSMVIAAASHALGTSTKDILTFSTTSNTTPTVTPSPMSPLSAEASPKSAYSPASPPNDFVLPSSPGTLSFVGKEDSDSKGPYQEHRRQAHLSAEQKRRCNLKTGFDALLTLVPSLVLNPKVSKAAMLQKTADYCKKLKNEKIQMQKEAEILRNEIETLNSGISVLQSRLPETGVPVTRQRVDHLREMFHEYVRNRTMQDWKFFIFSHIIEPLFESYNSMVSTANVDELCRTLLAWLDQHCSLTALRPTVLNALRHLSTTTSILSEPSRVREQATEAVTRRNSTGSARDTRH